MIKRFTKLPTHRVQLLRHVFFSLLLLQHFGMEKARHRNRVVAYFRVFFWTICRKHKTNAHKCLLTQIWRQSVAKLFHVGIQQLFPIYTMTLSAFFFSFHLLVRLSFTMCQIKLLLSIGVHFGKCNAYKDDSGAPPNLIYLM